MTREEMDRLGWEELDVLLVTGDAYVDHPSFGAALLGRWLVHHGFRTGIAAQPRWEAGGEADLAAMGRPRLFAGATAGCLDSLLAHYTAFRKKRREDAYTPGGLAGKRPNRAAIAYANLLRRAFRGLPVVLGGIEASLRRAAHYDFWSDSLRRSIVLDAKATAVLYGMAETSILALARGLDRLDRREGPASPEAGPRPGDLADLLWTLPGAAFALRPGELPRDADLLELPGYEAILDRPARLIEATLLLERQVRQDRQTAVQAHGDRVVAMTPPGPGLSGEELDLLHSLPFTRRAHPSYHLPVPAEEMIRTSVNAHRGCAGGCSFCTLALHQGRRIRSRSRESVLDEVRRIAAMPEFTGSVSDVGGPSANMWGARCAGDPSRCARSSCLTPEICRHFRADQGAFVELLRAVARVPGVRHVRVASGWRMDLGLADRAALAAMVREFVGGQAKVAPEHLSGPVLALMRKPPFAVFEEFVRLFEKESGRAGKEQYVVPYLMSAHPGCTDADMAALAGWLKARGWRPTQVQCFIPLPGTAAAAMFYAGADLKGRPLYVARTDAQRLRQHGLLVPARDEDRGPRPGRGPSVADRERRGRGEKPSAPGRPPRSGAADRDGSRGRDADRGRSGGESRGRSSRSDRDREANRDRDKARGGGPGRSGTRSGTRRGKGG